MHCYRSLAKSRGNRYLPKDRSLSSIENMYFFLFWFPVEQLNINKSETNNGTSRLVCHTLRFIISAVGYLFLTELTKLRALLCFKLVNRGHCTAHYCCPIGQFRIVLYNQSAFVGFWETSSYWSVLWSAHFFSFHWSPYG